MKLVSFGTFFRKHDATFVRRYRCPTCHKSFSESTSKDCFNQKKPYLNPWIAHALASLTSQRRTAFVFSINRKTVIRKFLLMGKKAERILPLLNSFFPDVQSWEFDDLESFEHTKCRPLSVLLAVERRSRWILGFRIASSPVKGKNLRKKALRKYGKRIDNRKQKRRELFKEIENFIAPNSVIRSDMNPHYASDVQSFFPNATYQTFRSRRAAATGQGELKEGSYDPIFAINHTFASLRENVNRLIKKTWCTTKKQARLGYHIALYAIYHNMLLINWNKKDAPLRPV